MHGRTGKGILIKGAVLSTVHTFCALLFLVGKYRKLAENYFPVLMAATMYVPVNTLKCEYICMYLLKLEASFKISYTD